MIELLRNCAHGSEVAVWRMERPAARFVKVALTPDGRKALDNEIAGWTWYRSVRRADQTPFCRTLRHDRHVVRIEIEALAGRQGRAAAGITSNEPLLEQAIDQYVQLWPVLADGMAPLHGDFSCDNFIAAAGGLFVIDWEHFHPAGAPWGFDAVYLVAESLYFQVQQTGGAGRRECAVARRLLRRLGARHTLRSGMEEAPVAFAREFIGSHAHLWGAELTRYPLKLPILAMSDVDVRRLDEGVRAATGAAR
jgi:aminoglycoside phosphotransferase (APT) family kinase protein